jgi:hypothetical protein
LGMVSYWFHMDVQRFKPVENMLIFQQLAWHDLTANLCSCMQQLTVSKHWQGPHIDVHHRRLWQQKNKRYPTKHTGVRTLFCHRSKKLHPLWHPEGWACNEGWKRRWSTWSS